MDHLVDVPQQDGSKQHDSSVDPATRHGHLRCGLSLLILLICFPISVLFVGVQYLRAILLRNWTPLLMTSPVNGHSQTVLVTGGKMSKSLQFARWLWRAGYKVILVETPRYRGCASRFSRAVHAFECIPCPRSDPEGYVLGLVTAARKHGASFFVPVASPAAAVPDAAAKTRLEAVGCKSMHFDLEQATVLDNKHAFCKLAADLGLAAPESYLVTSALEVHKLNRELSDNPQKSTYILKNMEYDPIHRLDLFQLPASVSVLNAYLEKIERDGNPIQPDRPWQVQRFLTGPEYSAFAVIRDGTVRALTTSRSSASQLNFQHIEHQGIEQWVRRFAASSKMTGQLCFDFIQDAKTGITYPIECNPRVHSQCSVFPNDDQFGKALLQDTFTGCLLGNPRAEPVYWLYNELFKLLPDRLLHYGGSDSKYSLFWRAITHKEADFDLDDPMPFFMKSHFQLPYLLVLTMLSGNEWKKMDFCIGKVVEMGGD